VSAFFISLGMLFDVRVVAAAPVDRGVTVASRRQGVLATVAALSMRFPARVAWLAGSVWRSSASSASSWCGCGGRGRARCGADGAAPGGGYREHSDPAPGRDRARITAGERLLAPLSA
jgi:CPA2 family monovalent cation:H+ antiporter-2